MGRKTRIFTDMFLIKESAGDFNLMFFPIVVY